MRKYSKLDQKTLAACAADWGERVIPLFEAECPEDDRPMQAIKTCRRWVRTGIFHMAEIRSASLAAHAEARVTAEREWQAGRLRGRLRHEFLGRVLVDQKGGRIVVNIRKGADFWDGCSLGTSRHSCQSNFG